MASSSTSNSRSHTRDVDDAFTTRSGTRCSFGIRGPESSSDSLRQLSSIYADENQTPTLRVDEPPVSLYDPQLFHNIFGESDTVSCPQTVATLFDQQMFQGVFESRVCESTRRVGSSTVPTLFTPRIVPVPATFSEPEPFLLPPPSVFSDEIIAKMKSEWNDTQAFLERITRCPI